jgi:hypothetical protein
MVPTMAQYTFVAIGKSGKPRPKDRKAIRSHCMIGKNVLPLQIDLDTTQSKYLSRLQSSQQTRKQRNGECELPEDEVDRRLQVHMPRAPPSDLRLIPSADRLDDNARELIFNCAA